LLSSFFLFVVILPEPVDVVPPTLFPTPPDNPPATDDKSILKILVTFPIIFETWLVEVVVVVVVRTP